MAKILVAADGSRCGKSIEGGLTLTGHDVTHVLDGASALVELDRGEVELLISDLHLPYLDGIFLAGLAGATPTKPPVILLTSTGWTRQDADRAASAGVASLLVKDTLRAGTLCAEVDRLLAEGGRDSHAAALE